MLAEALLAAVTEAVFGYLLEKADLAGRVRQWLGQDPSRLAFQRALGRAYIALARQYPEWTASLFDQNFLAGPAAPELAQLLTRSGRPDPAIIARRWAAYLGITDLDRWAGRLRELTAVCADLIHYLESELKEQPALQPLFDSRALEQLAELAQDVAAIRRSLEEVLERAAKYEGIVRQAQELVQASYTVTVPGGQGVVVGERAQVSNVFHTYFDADYATLDELYLCPDPVFERVRLDEFVGREWLAARLDRWLDDPARDCGVWLLKGEAGVGKTTFLAHLVRERRYLHFFAEQAPGDGGVVRALESLCAQLVARFRLEPYAQRGTLPGSLVHYADFFERLLRLAAEPFSKGSCAWRRNG